MPVLTEGDVEVWIFFADPARHVRCFVKGFEVVIDLNAPSVIQSYDSNLPSPSVLRKALQTVKKNLELLRKTWDEMEAL